MKKITKIVLSLFLGLSSFAMISKSAGGGLRAYKEVRADSIPSGQVLDNAYDTVSVSDFTFNDLTNQTMIANTTNVSFSFSGENVHKSLAFRFKYDIRDTDSGTTTLQIHFDVANDVSNQNNAYLLRGDHNYIKNSSYGWKQVDGSLPVGVYDIEFGRKALLDESSGNPTGRYYVYYKIGGVEKGSSINEYNVETITPNIRFYFGGSNKLNKIYDISYGNTLTYEEPQIIGVADLKRGDNFVGLSIPDTGTTYQYSLTDQPTNKSVVFVAEMDYRTAETSQIYIVRNSDSANWKTSGYVQISKDSINMGVTDESGAGKGNQRYGISPNLSAGSHHTIEFGRLAILNSGVAVTNGGVTRYQAYFKLDGKLVCWADQYIESDAATGGRIHTTGDSGFDYVESRLETPKEISVSDLSDNTISNYASIDIDGQLNLTYDNSDHTDNYSLVFNFQYETKELKNNQFHLTNNANKWKTASSFILNNDKDKVDGKRINLGKSDSETANISYHNVDYDFSIDTVYDIEYGRIALVYNGTFLNKYYIYQKINGTVVKYDIMGVPADVVSGNLVFITADGANRIYDKNYVSSYGTAINSVNSYMKLGFSFEESAGSYTNVKTMFGVGIDKTISTALVPVDYTYGIEVKTSSKAVCYNSSSLTNGDLYYKYISLGDVITHPNRATDVFTVRAYIEVDGLKYFTEAKKVHSVNSLIDYYLGLGGLTDDQVDALESLHDAIEVALAE